MPKPDISLEEFEKASTRTYTGVNKKQVIYAIEKIFKLADYKDFNISYTSNGIKGIRWEALFLNNYYYYWDVTCNETENGILVSTDISTEIYPHTPRQSANKSVLNLFYNRLDYLLGKNKHWPSCSEYTSRKQKKQVEALCSNADDKKPQ